MADSHSDDDAPQTPAPLFAVRAFKHALFGTPKPMAIIEQKSATTASTFPGRKDRPRSSGKLAVDNLGLDFTAQSSPAKGILVTPGTVGARRKTVSFGTPGARDGGFGISATPRDIPGKYPSPWVPKSTYPKPLEPGSAQARDLQGDKLENHTSNDSRNVTISAASRPTKKEDDTTVDLGNPRSTSGKYWKTEFDSYASKSETEMRKLVKKEQIAKKFAKLKDGETRKVEEQLLKEQQKVNKLEQRVEEYVSQLSLSVEGYQRQRKLSKDSPSTNSPPSSPSNRSALRKAENALTAANAKIEALQRRNNEQQQDLESRIKDQAEKIARLREELQNERNQRDRNDNKRAQSNLGSDVWADIHVESTGPDSRRLRGRGRSSEIRLEKPSRSPLRQRNENAAEIEPREDKGKPSKLTEERKEAARLRLEAKRRERSKVYV